MPLSSFAVRSLPTFFVSTALAASALAQDDLPPTPDVGLEGAAPKAASAGAFLGLTQHARTDTHRGLLHVQVGRVGHLGWSRAGAAEVTLLEPGSAAEPPRTGRDIGLAVRAGGFLRGDDEELRGELGLRAQFVFEADAGFDLALGLGYEDEGFNLRPAVVPSLAMSTHLGSVLLLANLVYGHGLADEERFGAVRLAALQPLSHAVRVGLDSALELDLELDEDEPEGEPQIVLQGGPIATLALGYVALSAQAGLTLVQLRFESARLGGLALVGAGGAF